MSAEEKYHELYNNLLREVTQIHKSIQHSIRKGLRALVIVTVLFLIFMFVTRGSKVIILLLWIVTMFAMAAYLIAIEYLNYEMYKKVEKVTQREHEELAEVMIPANLEFHLPELRLSRQKQKTGEAPAESEANAADAEVPELTGTAAEPESGSGEEKEAALAAAGTQEGGK